MENILWTIIAIDAKLVATEYIPSSLKVEKNFKKIRSTEFNPQYANPPTTNGIPNLINGFNSFKSRAILSKENHSPFVFHAKMIQAVKFENTNANNKWINWLLSLKNIKNINKIIFINFGQIWLIENKKPFSCILKIKEKKQNHEIEELAPVKEETHNH